MSFHDVRFPEHVGRGSVSAPGVDVHISKLDSGREVRLSLWDGVLRRFDARYQIRSLEMLEEVNRFFIARNGATHSFRYKDPLDYHTGDNPTHRGQTGTRDMPMSPAVGDGSTTQFQLVKTYTSGSTTVSRTIVLPVSGTISLWVDGTAKTEGVDYTISYVTGVVTFASALTAGQVPEWSGEFDTHVRFGEETSKSLGGSIDGWDVGSIPSIPLDEVDETTQPNLDQFFYGGASEISLSASRSISTESFLWTLSATATGLYVSLPNPASMSAGGFYFCIQNVGTNSIAVKNNSGTTLVTLAQNKAVFIGLTVESGGVKTWTAFGG